MKKRTLRSILTPLGIFVVATILLGMVPAAAASYAKAPRGVTPWDEYANLIAPPLAGEASRGNLTGLASLMGAKSVEPSFLEGSLDFTPPSLVLPPGPYLADQRPAQAEYTTSSTEDADALAVLLGRTPPSTTWDKLRSKGSERSALGDDDQATVTSRGGGELRTADGWLKVQFPPGAVSEDVRMTYKRAGYAPHPVLDSRDTYVAFGLKAYNQSGQEIRQFARPITITLSYGEDSGIGPQVDLFYWSEQDSYWSFVPSIVDPVARTLTATSLHFTDYSISDANQIEPDLIAGGGYQTDLFTGTSTGRYAIEVPPGRNGLTPNLSLVYPA